MVLPFGRLSEQVLVAFPCSGNGGAKPLHDCSAAWHIACPILCGRARPKHRLVPALIGWLSATLGRWALLQLSLDADGPM